MISNTDMFHTSGGLMPGSRGCRPSPLKNSRSANGQPRNRKDYVIFGRALIENPLYPDARVVEELAGAMLRKVFNASKGA
jgi:hypothetical protein